MASWSERQWWSGPEEGDVVYARSKLDDVLQVLRENPEKAKESSKYKDDILRKADEKRDPMKPGSGRRRKRRSESDDEDTNRDSFKIKIFERNVDFGLYDEKTPIYPMVRHWIQNITEGKWTDIPKHDDEPTINTTDNLPDAIYHLPTPNDSLTDAEAKVPKPLIDRQGTPLNLYSDPTLAPQPEHLLVDHLSRWKRVRKCWWDSFKGNEDRHKEAMTILKDMFEKNYKADA